MATDVITKQDLLDGMRATGPEFVAAIRGLSAEQLAEGRYEEGWTARDIVAHVASIEWTYPKLLHLARGLVPEKKPEREKTVKSADLPGDYNQRHVAKRAGNTVEELLEEFERNRAATIAAVEEADEDLLRRRVRSAGGVEGTAAEVMNYLTVVHLRGHLEDIRGQS